MTDATEARRARAEATLSRHISEAVATAPPLTPEQRQRLTVLLTASTTSKEAAGAAPKDEGEDTARQAIREAKLRRAVEEAVATIPPLSEEVKAAVAHLLTQDQRDRVASGPPSSITQGIVPSMSNTEKVRENRLRRAAQRQGLMLAKSRRRDPRATDYGTYMLVDAATNAVVASGSQSGYGMTLDDIEERLNS